MDLEHLRFRAGQIAKTLSDSPPLQLVILGLLLVLIIIGAIMVDASVQKKRKQKLREHLFGRDREL
jgi:hypothetical protein